MKRVLIAALLCIFILYGCTEAPSDTTAPSVTQLVPSAPALYQPGSELEKKTGGAVRIYDIAMNNGGDILPMGEDILVFSYGEEFTTLTRLTGVNGIPVRTAQLRGIVSPCGNNVQIENNSLAYYDPVQHCVVFLDGMLQQTKIIELPEDILGIPVISSGLNEAYYAVEKQIRRVDLDSGVSGLLRTQETGEIVPLQLIHSDGILECRCVDQNGNAYMEYISAANGQTLEIADDIVLSMDEDMYFAQLNDAYVCEYLYGSAEGNMLALYPKEQYLDLTPILSHKLLVGQLVTEDGVQIDVFDLVDGHRTANVVIPGLLRASGAIVDSTGTGMWFIGIGENANHLCRLDLAKASIEDPVVYTGHRFTADDPDEAGLQKLQGRMKEMSSRYQVEIQLWDAMETPEGYSFRKEYRVPAVEKTLDRMEPLLARFPNGFFEQLEDGKLIVEFVYSITGNTEKEIAEPRSLAYWKNGQGHIAIACGEDFDAAFYHALSHILDAYVYANSLAYDDWNQLNPAGFSYDNSYSFYTARKEGAWLDGEDRAFVDEFSKTYAKEDRAGIFTRAMLDGCSDVFTSEAMQSKLRRMSRALREAFGWEKDDQTFPWEQYLLQ